MKMIPTKIEITDFQWNVDTPNFLREACNNCNGGMYAVCWNIFARLLANVATRASELNDPVLNVLMLQLNMYEIDNKDGDGNAKRVRLINDITKAITQKTQKNEIHNL